MKVLVVDDEKETREFLRTTLQSEMYAVDTAENGTKGSYAARTNDYDLIILDCVMPEKNGLEVCREIRESGRHIPILMLSVNTEIGNKTTLLDAGADDYLTKPYSHRELLSRMKALLRRGNQIEQPLQKAGDITLNSAAQEVWRGKKSVYLTRKEFILLELLMKNKNRIVSRGMILEHVWDMEGDPLSKTIETHIGNLRKKIGVGSKKIILNVPGRGYKIVE